MTFAALTYLNLITPLDSGAAYIIKIIFTGAVLTFFWPWYSQEIQWRFDWLAVAAGIIVFLVWVGLEGRYPQIGQSSFDPYLSASNSIVAMVIGVRFFGAALIVPLVEELFWRSFIMRFLVVTQFKSVPLGQFTWYSFVLTAVAFGFEHHRWLPGIFAGVVYATLLCRTRNLCSPIQAHFITNLLLGIYVICTGQWTYW